MVSIDLMYISMASILPPTILGAVFLKKLPTSLKLLVVFIFCCAIIELIAFVMYKRGVNNMLIYHIHTFIEFGIISCIYYLLFKGRKLLRRLVVFFFIAFIILSLISLTFWGNTEIFNSMQRSFEYGFLIFYFLAYSFILIRSSSIPRLENHPYFILTAGFIVYFTGTLYLFLGANNFVELGEVDYWMIHSILNIFLNIIYIIVLWTGNKVARLL